jgi:uncharacterized protein
VVRERLIVFYKPLCAGKVKTRLAAGVGAVNSLKFYQAFLTDLRSNVADFEGILCPMISEHPNPGEDFWVDRNNSPVVQTGDSLGDRMYNAFSLAFDEGHTRIILIGSDIPYLDPVIIRSGFRALEEKDAVIGPSVDGGYYLIGFAVQPIPKEVFSNISWSTSEVYAETVDRFKKYSITYRTTAVLQDIDNLADLGAVSKNTEYSRFMPNTLSKIKETNYVFS